MKKRYHSVCSDLDETLLMPDKTISAQTQEVLHQLIARGINVIPCTGRAFWSIPDCVMNFPGLKYAVVSNGAAIYDLEKREAVLSYTLDPSFPGNLIHYLKEGGEYVVYEGFIRGQAYTSRQYFDDPAYFGITNGREKAYVQKTRIPVEDIESFLLEHAGELDAMDVILMPEEKDRVMREISETFDGVYLTSSVPFLIEISNENSGKHNGIQSLMNYLGLDMDGVVAFGDGDNDQEMLRSAGLGLAMENATDKCKSAADQVIGKSREDGVALFLKETFDL